MRPLQIQIIQALEGEDELLTVPAIVHRMKQKIDKTAAYHLVNQEALNLAQQGLLIHERRGSGGGKPRPNVFMLSDAMKEALVRQVNG